MRTNTAKIIAAMSATAPESMAPSDIDVIITYVNGADQDWLREYIRTTKVHKATPVRFRSWGTLKYLMRGIENYMFYLDQLKYPRGETKRKSELYIIRISFQNICCLHIIVAQLNLSSGKFQDYLTE